MSVTAVPLRPIQKGSVLRLALGVVFVLALALLLAWFGNRQFGKTASGLKYQILEEGTGASPTPDDFALVAYKGTLPDGTVFDENPGAPMELGTTVKGFSEAVTLMKKGGKIRAWLPADLAYGASPPPNGPIPANSPLTFEIKLLEFKTRAEIMEAQRQMQMQRMMQQGMPGGAPPGAEAPQMPEGIGPQ